MGSAHKNKEDNVNGSLLAVWNRNSTIGTQKKGMVTFILIRSLAVPFIWLQQSR